MTSRQIADSRGFPDEFNFSRRFRQRLGIPPRGYPQQIRRALTQQSPPSALLIGGFLCFALVVFIVFGIVHIVGQVQISLIV